MAEARATARKKTAARPTAPARPAPMVDLSKDRFDHSKVKKLFLFELDGTDYYIPSDAPASVLSKVARIETETGQGAAMWWLFGKLIGPEAVTALENSEDLSRTQLAQLYTACLSVLTGPKA